LGPFSGVYTHAVYWVTPKSIHPFSACLMEQSPPPIPLSLSRYLSKVSPFLPAPPRSWAQGHGGRVSSIPFLGLARMTSLFERSSFLPVASFHRFRTLLLPFPSLSRCGRNGRAPARLPLCGFHAGPLVLTFPSHFLNPPSYHLSRPARLNNRGTSMFYRHHLPCFHFDASNLYLSLFPFFFFFVF